MAGHPRWKRFLGKWALLGWGLLALRLLELWEHTDFLAGKIRGAIPAVSPFLTFIESDRGQLFVLVAGLFILFLAVLIPEFRSKRRSSLQTQEIVCPRIVASVPAGYDPEARLTLTNEGTEASFRAYAEILSVVEDVNPTFRLGVFSLRWLETADPELRLRRDDVGSLLLADSHAVIPWDLYELRLRQAGTDQPFAIWRWNFSDDLKRPGVALRVRIVADPPLATPFEQVFFIQPGIHGGIKTKLRSEAPQPEHTPQAFPSFPSLAISPLVGYVTQVSVHIKHPGESSLGIPDFRPGHIFFVLPDVLITNREREAVSISLRLKVEIDRGGFRRQATIEPNRGGFTHPTVRGRERLPETVNIPARASTPRSFLTFWLSQKDITGISIGESKAGWSITRGILMVSEHNCGLMHEEPVNVEQD